MYIVRKMLYFSLVNFNGILEPYWVSSNIAAHKCTERWLVVVALERVT